MPDHETTAQPSKAGPRHWGPFSGGQLTLVLCVLIVMLLIPVGAWAVAGSQVFITDSHSGARAAVDSSGALKVGGAVSASGSVTATLAAPSAFYVKGTSPTTGTYTRFATPPTGKALVVTALHIDTIQDNTPTAPNQVVVVVLSKGGTACGTVNSAAFEELITPPGIGDQIIPYTPGLAVPANRSLCAEEFGSISTSVQAVGYLVPASTVPATA